MPNRFHSSVSIAVFLAALAQVPLGLHEASLGEGYETAAIAKAIVQHKGFANPYRIPTGPTAHTAPIYPYIVAGVIAVAGEGGPATVVLILLNALLLAAAAGLVAGLAAGFTETRWPGTLAGVSVGLAGAMAPQSEAALACLAFVAVVIVADRSPIVVGACVGFTLLVSPAFLFGLLPLAGRTWRRASIAITVAGAICLPWILRNSIVLGGPTFLRDNLGLELAVSNAAQATAELDSNRAVYDHPTVSVAHARRIVEIGELRYNEERMGEALTWMRQNPRRFLWLTLRRIRSYWFPKGDYRSYIYWGVSLLMLPGIALTWRCTRARAYALALVGAWLPFILIQFQARYRYPALWIGAVFAAVTLERIWIRVSRLRNHGAHLV